MHPLTRQFAQERLSSSAQKDTAVATHGRYYLAWIIEQETALLGTTPQTAINAIKKDLDNLEQAWLWAKQMRQSDLLLKGLTALSTFCDVVGLLQEGEEIAESIILHVDHSDRPDEALLLCRGLIMKSHFIIDQGKFEPAAETLASALALAQRLQDEESVADIHHLYGLLLTNTGKCNEAKTHQQQALTIQRQLADDRKTAKILTNLGWTHIVNDDVEAAFPVLQEALELGRKAGHKHGEAFVKGNLAVAYNIKGEHQTALIYQQEVLAAYEELGDLLNIERAENNRGMTFLGLGQYHAALPPTQRAVALSRQIGTVPGLANCLDTLGMAFLACGYYEKAKSCLDEALGYAEEIGFVYMKYSVRALLLMLCNRTGKLAQAEEHLQQLRPLAEALQNNFYIARSLAEEAHLTSARGNRNEAIDLITQAIDIVRQHASQPDLPFYLLQHADYLLEQQEYVAAFPLVKETIAIAQRIDHAPLQMRANAQAAFLAQLLDEKARVQEHMATAAHFLRQLPPYPDTLAGLLYLGRYHLHVGNGRKATIISNFIANHPATSFTVQRHAKALQKETTTLWPNISANKETLNWNKFTAPCTT